MYLIYYSNNKVMPKLSQFLADEDDDYFKGANKLLKKNNLEFIQYI